MAGWDNFFVSQVGASAALAGLVFVGVSINLTKIMGYPGLPGRALEALAVLWAVLTISSLLLVPKQALEWVGGEVLVIGIIVWTTTGILQLNNLRVLEKHLRRVFMLRVGLGQLATLPFIIAGIILLTQDSTGVYWIVPANLFSFFVALLNSWILLIEINR